jgi:predicted nicotinamide N-methyase
MHYPLLQETIILPNGPFSLYLPEQVEVTNIYRQLQAENEIEPFPYWARLWPSAIALSAFLQKHPQWVAGKQVAELAAGIGLPSLIAATYAKQVWCSDIRKEAMEVAAKSARLHRFENIRFEACNWSNLPVDFNPEVVLLSDINYEPSVFDELEKVLKGLLQRGCTLLLATPQRLMAKPFLEKLSGFIANSHEEGVEADGQITFITIFELRLIIGKNE